MKQILLSAFYIQGIKKNISLFVQAQKTEKVYTSGRRFFIFYFFKLWRRTLTHQLRLYRSIIKVELNCESDLSVTEIKAQNRSADKVVVSVNWVLLSWGKTHVSARLSFIVVATYQLNINPCMWAHPIDTSLFTHRKNIGWLVVIFLHVLGKYLQFHN